jgi:hypothetical protein
MAPEMFPNPPIESNQVKAALFAVQKALDELEKKFSSTDKETAYHKNTDSMITHRKKLPTLDEYIEWSKEHNMFAVPEIYEYLTGSDLKDEI